MNSSSTADGAAIFGIPFDDTTLAVMLGEIDVIVAGKRPRYLVTPNLDFAAQAADDVELHRIILGAHRVLCDGMPLVWASRLLGAPLGRRVAGSDLVPLLAEHASKKGHRLYFLGSTPDVLEKAGRILSRRFPSLQIVGMDAPAFAPLLEMDHEAIGEKIRAARPDILLVAFGCPKQEKWIWMNHLGLGVPCSIGIGASLDFIAGKTRRAPRWMQKSGTEWIFRLLQEPGRLAKRYAWDLVFLAREVIRHTTVKTRTLSNDRTEWNVTQTDHGAIIDLEGIDRLDFRRLATLLRMNILALVGPSAAVRQILRIMRLDRLLPVVRSQEEARELLATAGQPLVCYHTTNQQGEEWLKVDGLGEWTIANADEIVRTVLASWDHHPTVTRMGVELQEVRFIDSAGLRAVLEMRRAATKRDGGRFELAGASPNVLNVLRLNGREDLLQ